MGANEVFYMLGVVAIGAGITFLFRAVPFLLFAGRNRPLPAWVERFGALVSPVIIAALIVYSYWGLAWRTPAPYLAGALTIALQLWKRNPLASILSGTILYMILLSCCGCATSPTGELRFDASKPCVAITPNGIKFGDRLVLPQEVPGLLKKHGVPKDATIHILLDDEYVDRRAPWVFQHNVLGRAGYRRSILVSKRRAESMTRDELEKRKAKQPAPAPKKFRYKKADE